MKFKLKKSEKKGQITIFIILGILIVAGISIFFIYIKPTYFPSVGGRLNFETCINKVVNEKINELGKNGGMKATTLTYDYQGEKIQYLCYTDEYYRPCTMQVPFLKQNFEENLLALSKEQILACVDSSINELEARGFEIQNGKREVNILINPKEVRVNLDIPVILTKGETSQKATLNPVIINSQLYDVLMISTSILQFEGKYGDSDVSALMLFYPEIIIDKMRQGEETKIYIVEGKNSKTKFQFASKSYPWPAGYGIAETVGTGA